MFHDIILALSGIGGDVLQNLYNEEILAISLSIHPCEKKILKQLQSIADSYKSLHNFLKKVPHFGDDIITLDDGFEVQPGMYLRAFSNGLNESLKPYRNNLIKLEKDILENPNFTILGIHADVTRFLPLLTALNSIVKQIITRGLHGCKILQILHQHLSSGIAMVDEAMARIMQQCHLVLLKQLTSLLLYGQLMDPYTEFFIEESQAAREVLHSSVTTLDTESLAENTGEDNLQEYAINHDLVPSYIPASIPEKVKFIGNTVMLFSRDPQAKKLGVNMKMHDSVYNKMESYLQDQLKTLQNSLVLDITFLESVVDNVRSCVTQYLFTLAKDEADLMGELRLIKDFYLLGRGELFVMFLRRAKHALLKPVSSNSTKDLENLLSAAVRNSQLNSDLILERFKFTVPKKDTVLPGTAVWTVMSLEYSPPWPLHLLFTPTVLSTYNTLFIFLLQVKLAELNLHDVWMDNVKRKKLPVSEKVWVLRNCLTFLINNLQTYLQLDVLESETNVMLTALDKTEDFEQVIHQHSVFLAHVTTQAFLLPREVNTPDQPPTAKHHPVNNCITNILKLCDDFCDELSNTKLDEVSNTKLNEEKISVIQKALYNDIDMLMGLIVLLGNKASGLRLLLLRLDYNKYFSSISGK